MIAEMTYGLLGRSPDHVASFVTGLAVNRPSSPPAFGLMPRTW